MKQAQMMQKLNKTDKENLAIMYVRYQLAYEGIKTMEIQKSLGFELLTNSMQNLSITSAVMTNHKTIKKNQEYNYNFWEFKVPEKIGQFLICVCFEEIDKNIKPIGYFIFEKSLIEKLGNKNTISIFESDLSGLYSREPKINKNKYFRNSNILKND